MRAKVRVSACLVGEHVRECVHKRARQLFKGAITSCCIFSPAETTEEVCSPPFQSGANFKSLKPLMHFFAFLPDAEGMN